MRRHPDWMRFGALLLLSVQVLVFNAACTALAAGAAGGAVGAAVVHDVEEDGEDDD